MDRKAYYKFRGEQAVTTFAVLKDGKWMQRGSMGWWGMVSDEKDNWYEEFTDILSSIPDNKHITIVDCHI